VEVATFGKILYHFSPIVPASAAGVRSRLFRRRGTRLGVWRAAGNGTLQNLPAENTQQELSRPKPTKVAVPIKEEEEEEEEET